MFLQPQTLRRHVSRPVVAGVSLSSHPLALSLSVLPVVPGVAASQRSMRFPLPQNGRDVGIVAVGTHW